MTVATGDAPNVNPPATPVLLADIGGTNARFALLAKGEFLHPRTLAVADFPAPLAAIRKYLTALPAPTVPVRAVLAVAGPVTDGKAHLTNAGWQFDAENLCRDLALAELRIINDFAAQAWSLPVLAAADLQPIGPVLPPATGPKAIIGPGTGFGVAAFIPAAGRPSVLVTEGGHATLAAESAREDSVLAALRQRFGHVSIERLLSGDGLARLYATLVALDGLAAPPRATPDIVTQAVNQTCPASHAALDLFCAQLGSAAGKTALTLGAQGGHYIGGGVVLHFTDYLARSSFRARFEAKGRMSSYLAAVPTYVVTHPQPAFLGLANYLA